VSVSAALTRCRRFRRPDFADEDDVRVLAQERPQRCGEREVDLLLDLHLVDAARLNSTGLSAVMMFTPGWLICDSAE
jgi:hypothetical protein